MARFTKVLHAKRDDPIYKEGLTISTPISGRRPTPSTPSSPSNTASPTTPASKAPAATAAVAAPSSSPKTRGR